MSNVEKHSIASLARQLNNLGLAIKLYEELVNLLKMTIVVSVSSTAAQHHDPYKYISLYNNDVETTEYCYHLSHSPGKKSYGH